ncbi:MAG: hypothetical protein JNL90_17725 [Planctomycetes bacterium]|nr:hypothetical protein [Planctomycetota bacterium]
MSDTLRPAPKKTAALLTGGVLLVVAATFTAFLGAKGCTPRPPPPLEIARETTWFTGPRLEGGGVDYPAAIAAEARATASALPQALARFVDPWSFAAAQARSSGGARDVDAEVAAAVAALQRGDTAAPAAALLLPWLDECAPLLAPVADAVKSGECRVAPRGLLLERPDPFPQLGAVTLALELGFARHAAAGNGEAALADATLALQLARVLGLPATFGEQARALEREAGTLAQLVRTARATTTPTAAELHERAQSQPGGAGGDSALREALDSARIELLDQLTAAWRGRVEIGPDPEDGSAQAGREHARAAAAVSQALAQADPNRFFRHANARCDTLDGALLGSDRPFAARVDDFLTALATLREAGKPLPPQRSGPLGRALLSADQLAEHVVDVLLGAMAARLELEFRDWLAQVVACEARLAELAEQAGAPRRRDRLLSEPLVTTRRSDGGCDVSGPLLELCDSLERRRR